MEIATINYIKNHPLIYNYLREDSTWYKELNRNPLAIEKLKTSAKEYYKKTPVDKLKKLEDNLELIATLIDVLN